MRDDDNTVYIHCSDGRGRTGTFVALLLAKLYPQYKGAQALAVTQNLYVARSERIPGGTSPATRQQEKQASDRAWGYKTDSAAVTDQRL
jgi:hypothetical protein